ncbi:MAG: hypothetical protein ACP5UN_01230 [Candidatus Micrarchaeia archaeon]
MNEEPKVQNEQSRENTLNELRYMQQLYLERYNEINRTLNQRLNILNHFYMVQEQLENIDLIEQNEFILPISEITFARMRITNNVLLVNIGSNFLVEENIENVKRIASKYITKENLNIEKLQKNKKTLEKTLNEIEYNMSLLQI